MRIQIPETLEEMNLGQLVALGRCYQLSLKENKTYADLETMDAWYAIFLDISENNVRRLFNAGYFEEVNANMEILFLTVITKYSYVPQENDKANVFECLPVSFDEMELLKIEKESHRWKRLTMRLPKRKAFYIGKLENCLLYTSPSPRDATLSRMPSSA